MKVVKRRIEIEAVQYISVSEDGEIQWNEDPPEWLLEALEDEMVVPAGAFSDSVMVITLEGEMIMKPGDYLMRGVEGELYPCAKRIFDATYDVL